ncbi:DUF6380 family protein [Streptomyces sp. B21-106]
MTPPGKSGAQPSGAAPASLTATACGAAFKHQGRPAREGAR